MPRSRMLPALLSVGALCLPVVACGEDDARDQVDQAREDIRQQAKKVEGDIDDLSKDDLREALRDAQDAAENGGADAKREARRLERKIERELRERDGG